eukprot:TRINITY_DN112311_c0_g1_i1.p1 TRINITY_DN112311_c0_g1~~TRINITY_DN112311_c0_g1_i1.p1  ORF type:complete len:365 (+),score=31.14 TRINITY_DN112311_c0_g1_i1:142-1095(+)
MLNGGYAYFDTAPFYGLGLAEHRLGAALYPHRKHRSSFIVSSKIGRVLQPVPNDDLDQLSEEETQRLSGGWPSMVMPNTVKWDYTAEGVRRSHADSLQRMRLGRIDCLSVHDLDSVFHTPPELETHRNALLSSGLPELQKMKQEGLISAVGVSLNGHAEQQWIVDLARRAAETGSVDYFMIAGSYTLLCHTAWTDGLVDICKQANIGIVMASPFNSGILATGAVPGAKYFYVEADEATLSKVRTIESLCQKHNTTLQAAAVQFPLGCTQVASIVYGPESADQFSEVANAMEQDVPDAFWNEMRELQLLPQQVPTPAD